MFQKSGFLLLVFECEGNPKRFLISIAWIPSENPSGKKIDSPYFETRYPNLAKGLIFKLMKSIGA
jgi:hypothetical protein